MHITKLFKVKCKVCGDDKVFKSKGYSSVLRKSVARGACALVGAHTAPRWLEAGCSVVACPGAGRAQRRPMTPDMS